MPSDITLKFTQADLAVLDKALGALPYKEVAALIAKINAQIQAQTTQPEAKSQGSGT